MPSKLRSVTIGDYWGGFVHPKHFVAIIGAIMVIIGIITGLQQRPADCGTVYIPADEGMAKDGSMHLCTNFDPILFATAWALTIVGVLVVVGALFVRWKKPPPPPANWTPPSNWQHPPPPPGWR